MCEHSNREAAMVTIRDGIWCDPCLAPLVTALNDGGQVTVASCCGHEEPGRLGWVQMADGRVLVIAPDLAAAHHIHDTYERTPMSAQTLAWIAQQEVDRRG